MASCTTACQAEKAMIGLVAAVDRIGMSIEATVWRLADEVTRGLCSAEKTR